MATSGSFFILGCQRSGTTLLGMLLAAHPGIEIVEEDDRRFHPSGPHGWRLDTDAVERFLGSNHQTVGFKSPRDTHRVGELITRVASLGAIWISRDVYQVVASMISLRVGLRTWAARFAAREVHKYLRWNESPALASLLEEISTTRLRRHRSIQLATLCWIAKQQTRDLAFAQWPDRLLAVKYDRLVCEPRSELGRILEFIDLDWHDQVLDHCQVLVGKRPGGSDTQRPVDRASLGKWRQQLTVREIELIDSLVEQADARD